MLMMKISGQYLWPFSNEGERMLHVHCRAGKGFAVNNLILVSSKIVERNVCGHTVQHTPRRSNWLF